MSRFFACLLIATLLPVGSSLADEPIRKDPTLSAILSVMVTGVGQIYNNQYAKGAAIIAIELGCFVGFAILVEDDTEQDGETVDEDDIDPLILIPSAIFVANKTYSAIDGYRSSKRINERATLMSRLRLSPIAGRKGVKFSFSF